MSIRFKAKRRERKRSSITNTLFSREGGRSLRRFSPGSAILSTVPPIVYDVLGTSGKSMPQSTRNFMESRFGHDFSAVRIHNDDHAAASAQAVKAKAYTVGQDIVFGRGQYTPDSGKGLRLMAHELAHVVQQDVGGTPSQTEEKAKAGAESVVHGHPLSPDILGGAGPGLYTEEENEPETSSPTLRERHALDLSWGALSQSGLFQLLPPPPELAIPSPDAPHLRPPSSLLSPSPTLFPPLPQPSLLSPPPTLFPPLPQPSLLPPSPTLFPPLPRPSLLPPSPQLFPPSPFSPLRPGFPGPPPLVPPLPRSPVSESEESESASPELPSRISLVDSGRFSLGLRLGFPGLENDPRFPQTGFEETLRQAQIFEQTLTGNVPSGWELTDKGQLAGIIWSIFSTHIAPDFARSLRDGLTTSAGPGGVSFELDLTLLTDFSTDFGGGLSFTVRYPSFGSIFSPGSEF